MGKIYDPQQEQRAGCTGCGHSFLPSGVFRSDQTACPECSSPVHLPPPLQSSLSGDDPPEKITKRSACTLWSFLVPLIALPPFFIFGLILEMAGMLLFGFMPLLGYLFGPPDIEGGGIVGSMPALAFLSGSVPAIMAFSRNEPARGLALTCPAIGLLLAVF